MKALALFILLCVIAQSAIAQTGQVLEKTIEFENTTRSYLLYVPDAYDDSTPWPLVFSLHGANSNPVQQMGLSLMNAVADTAHFLIAYADGLRNAEGFPGWNDRLSPELSDDVGFISAAIDMIYLEYNVDLQQVYATGMSNGSAMTFTLACELSDRIAAVGSVAAPGASEDCTPEREISIMHIQGTADRVVPFEGGVGELVDIVFPSTREHIQFWIDHNKCTGDPTILNVENIVRADSSTITVERYESCANETEVALYVVENGGHTWPGGSRNQIPSGLEDLIGIINRDINASAEIWRFFSRHRHPNPFIPTGVATEAENIEPPGIELVQNYPNPFSGSTRIRYTLDDASRVDLVVYDILGREVEVVVQQFQSSGQHEITFDASSLAGGVYLYTLDVGGQKISRKLIVMN